MAKYEDYMEDELGNEIVAAAANTQARDAQGRFIPERFQNKDIGDVIQSFEELEKLNSRQANDLGDMRRTVDQLLELQTQSSPAEEVASPLSSEDLYSDPDAAVRRVVREESSSEIKSLKDEVSQLRHERKMSALEDKYPDWQTRSNSSEFSDWANGSPYRKRIATDAAGGDFDAAEEILGMYYDSHAENEVVEDAAPIVSIEDAQLERSSPAPVELGDTYSRNELLEVRMAAKRGDLKAERWLKAHADSIAIAYAENRIVD